MKMLKEAYAKAVTYIRENMDILDEAAEFLIQRETVSYTHLNKIHPMIWSPLAGGRLFQEDDLQCKKAMDKIKEIAERHNCEPDTIVYAWTVSYTHLNRD